jgi:GDP-4-dehydro-6-deoxy-D-mannose reductase
MTRILVSGVNGFVGKHLVREINSRGYKAVGVGREENVHPQIESLLDNYYSADLINPDDVKKIPLENINAVISLAGLAQAGASFKDPEKYLKINVDVATVLAEEILKRKLPIRFVAISTGAVYDSNQAMPLTEKSVLIRQGSPYAKSKILMEEALTRLKSQGLNCILVRPFNHIGPGQEPGFLVPDLYKKISKAHKGGGSIKVGDLNTKRDFTDVRDVVKAYVNLATTDNLDYDLYNVCSGKSLSGQQILSAILEAMHPNKKIEIKQDPSLIRPNDPKDLYGSNQRISEVMSWQPKIDLAQTIADFVANERQKEN